VTLSVLVARYAASEALWKGSSTRVETGMVVVDNVVEVLGDVDDVVAEVVVVAPAIEVEERGWAL
jgi:hypothetical protein